MSNKKNIKISELKLSTNLSYPQRVTGLKLYKYHPDADYKKYPNLYYDISDKDQEKRISDFEKQRGYSTQLGTPPMYSSDLIDTEYFISGVVTAHFTFPVVDMKYPEDSGQMIYNSPVRNSKETESAQSNVNTEDVFDQIGVIFDDVSQIGGSVYPSDKPTLPNFVWEGVNYGEYYPPNNVGRPPTLNRGSHDLIFIQDSSGAIAILNTQFYGNSYVDASIPPNVDSGYIPSRYHIKVGDILEVYSGILVKQSFIKEWFPIYRNTIINRDEVEYWVRSWATSNYTKTYLSLTEPMMYRVIPNNSYTPVDSSISWEKNDLNGRVKVDTFLPEPIRRSIPLITESAEGLLVRIRNVKLNVPTESRGANKTVFLEPGRLYGVVDNSGNEISFRVCHGTDISKIMPAFPVDKEFDLIGIVAGPNRNGYMEIWPRTMYDIGLGKQSSSNTTSNLIDIVNSI